MENSAPVSTDSASDALDFSESRAARKEHQKIVDWTKQQFSAIKNARTVTERQWYMNLAFYFGKQNVVPLRPTSVPGAGISTRFYVPPAPYYRARPVINRIRPTIRTELSQLTGNRPNASIVPASAEDRDMYAAMAGEQIWESFYNDKKIKSIVRKAMWWTLVCGTGFIKSYWDHTAGPVEQSISPEGQLSTEPQGDVIFRHETPFHVLCPDLREEELENQPFLIHAQVKSPDFIRMKFQNGGLDGKPINPQTAQAMDILEDSFLNLVGAQALDKQHSVLVLELWVKPGVVPMFPEGAFFTLIGDQIVQGFQGWPFRHGKFPFAKFDHIPGGKFYSSSVIEDLIPLQKEYNRCYDSNTEILTDRGWELGVSLKPGDQVLTFNPNNKKMKFDYVQEMFLKEYSGPMTVLEGTQISARTTPGHKWFVKSSTEYDKIVTNLTLDHSIPLCAPVELQGDDNYRFNKIVGLVLTDGRFSENKVFISQSDKANSDKCDEIEWLLSDEGVCYSTYGPNKYGMVDYYIPIDYSWRIKQAIPNKRLTANYIMTLGNKGLQGLYDGMILGDGMIKEDKGDRFYTSIESEADLFQMIANLLGKPAKKRIQAAKSSWSKREFQYIVTVKTEKFSKATVFRAKKEDEYYEGTVWCPTVKTGFVFVRRNGTSYISGNTRGQIIEAKNRMAKPQLVAPRGSVDPSKITTEPGQVIQYTPGFQPPQPLPLTPLPSYVLQEVDRIIMDWNDISGQHEVTQGQVPAGVTAATAISFLQERDESKLSLTFDSMEEGIEKIAQMSLSYVNEFWSQERMVKVTGPEGSFDTMALKGSDLDNNLDIRVEAGSALPVSKAAKQALIMDMMKMGFIDPRKGLEVMDMGGINKLYEQVQVDQRQAQRENLRMSKVNAQMMEEYNQQNMQMLVQDPMAFDGLAPPIIVPVNTWDNHKLHIEYHNNYRKSQAFEVLSPEIKTLFESHVQQHIMALGMETESMDPRQAAGLPPDPMMEEEQEEQGQQPGQPGPEPMPEGVV